jgi:hypothetical protein
MLGNYKQVIPNPEVEDEIQACEWVSISDALVMLSPHRKPLLEYVTKYIL